MKHTIIILIIIISLFSLIELHSNFDSAPASATSKSSNLSGGFNVEIRGLRFEYGNIRATAVVHNNSGVDMKFIQAQHTLYNMDNEIISVATWTFTNVPAGAFGNEDIFWNATTETDFNSGILYRWRIIKTISQSYWDKSVN